MGPGAVGDGLRGCAGGLTTVSAAPVPAELLAAVTQRLMEEFGRERPIDEILATVRQCHTDLDAVPLGSIPEMVERLARQRLHPTSDRPELIAQSR
jgi:hypothetical protein